MSTTITKTSSSPLPTEMSDRFGPMLVKELRQGLRTKVFLTAFIGFQGILLIMVLAGFASQGSGQESGAIINSAVWGVLGMMLVVITPLRGQFALEKEMRAGTLELLQITNLDAWKIVRGKWTALMGEAMLYLTAALPYFTLRYFLGGVNILTDLGWLALMALVSATLTAIVIGLSGFRSVLLRIGITLGIVMFVPWMIAFIEMIKFSSRMGGSTFGFIDGWFYLIGLILTLLIVGWCSLRLGARTIATQAENHSTGTRLLTLVGLVALLILDRMNTPISMDESVPFLLMCMAVYAVGIFAAITDTSLQSSRIYAPFLKRKMTLLGRVLLYPGWGSGFFYVGLMSFLMLFVTAMREQVEAVLLAILIVFNFFMLPAAITRSMMRHRGIRNFNLATYITMMVACTIGAAVLQIAEAVITDGEPAVTMFFPLSAWIGAASGEEGAALAMQIISALAVTVYLLIMALDDFRFTIRREHATGDLLAKQNTQPEPGNQEESTQTS